MKEREAALRRYWSGNYRHAFERGHRLMLDFSAIRLCAVSTLAGLASVVSMGAQAFDNGSALGLTNGYVQQANLQTDVRRDVRPTRELVDDPTGARAGTISIDTKNRFLYFSMPGGKALRYGVGVGREGFAWTGRAHIGRRVEWPAWTPPADMRLRRPELPPFMEGGIGNPLGARAMYLYNGHGDTMFRIHGTSEPNTIGRAISSGCIRLLNEDIVDLYSRVKVGTPVVVF